MFPSHDRGDTVVECRIDGLAAESIEEIDAPGVTDETRAWRIGMRRLAKYQAMRYSVEGSTEMEIRNFNTYDRLTITDDMPGVSKSVEIRSFSDDSTTATYGVTESLDASGWTEPRVFMIDSDGVRTAIIEPVSLTDYTIEIDSADVEFVPVTDGSIDRQRLVVCELDEYGYDVMLTEISPTSMNETDFVGVEYSDSLYAYDDLTPE